MTPRPTVPVTSSTDPAYLWAERSRRMVAVLHGAGARGGTPRRGRCAAVGQFAAPAAALATRRMSRDLRLAAWFLWITPAAAALSIRLTAARSSSVLRSSPDSAAAMARLVRVRISERTDLLRRRRRSFWRFRLIWLRMLATAVRRSGVGAPGCAGDARLLVPTRPHGRHPPERGPRLAGLRTVGP